MLYLLIANVFTYVGHLLGIALLSKWPDILLFILLLQFLAHLIGVRLIRSLILGFKFWSVYFILLLQFVSLINNIPTNNQTISITQSK